VEPSLLVDHCVSCQLQMRCHDPILSTKRLIFNCSVDNNRNASKSKGRQRVGGHSWRQKRNQERAQTLRDLTHSAGCGARRRSFSTPLTSTAMAAVPITKPSAMTAAKQSTRSKPPLACRTWISQTAAPEARKVTK